MNVVLITAMTVYWKLRNLTDETIKDSTNDKNEQGSMPQFISWCQSKLTWYMLAHILVFNHRR